MENPEPTDAELVTRTIAGNRDAFARLYDRYARLIRAVVGGQCGDWNAVQDLTQECFLRAFRNLHRLRSADRFAPWLVGIARQVARERRRSLRRDRHEFVGDRPLEIATRDGESLQAAEQWQWALRKLAALPERERLAIQAFYLQEQDTRRAAETLELSRSGFYAVLARGLARLAAQWVDRQPQNESK